jgi:hypothetical protein
MYLNECAGAQKRVQQQILVVIIRFWSHNRLSKN